MNIMVMEHHIAVYKSIVNWNLTAGNRLTFTDDIEKRTVLFRQASRVIEEVKEALEAGDLVALLDGACDIIVTAAQGSAVTDMDNWPTNYGLATDELVTDIFLLNCEMQAYVDCYDWLVELGNYSPFTVPAFWRQGLHIGWSILAYLDGMYHVDVMAALQDVLADNWSKFILPDDTANIEATLEYYKQEGEPVITTNAMCNGERYIVFRRTTDNKIMKPRSYLITAALNLKSYIPTRYWNEQI